MNKVIKKRGRPSGSTADNTASKVFQMRIEPKQLEAYKSAAEKRELPVSNWAKSILDKISSGAFYSVELPTGTLNQKFITEITKQPKVYWDWLSRRASDSAIPSTDLMKNLLEIKVFLPFGLDLQYLEDAAKMVCDRPVKIKELNL